MNKNFFESIEQIAYERGLNINDVLAKVEVAMNIACKNSDVPYKGIIKLEANLEKKEVKFVDTKQSSVQLILKMRVVKLL